MLKKNLFIKNYMIFQCFFINANYNVQIIPLNENYKNEYKTLSEDDRILTQNISIINEKKHDFHKQFQYYISIKDPLSKKYILLNEENKLIGYIGFFKNDTSPNIIFIYYAIIPSEWGKGLGTLAVKKFIEMFKDKLKQNGFKKIKATVKIQNIGSKKVLLKNKFILLLDENNEPIIEYIDDQSIVNTLELNI